MCRRRRRGGHRSLGCVNRRRKSCLVKKPSLSRSRTHPLPHTLESRTHICASRCTHAHTLASVECLARMLGPEWHKTFLSGPGQGSQVLNLVGKPPDKPTHPPTSNAQEACMSDANMHYRCDFSLGSPHTWIWHKKRSLRTRIYLSTSWISIGS